MKSIIVNVIWIILGIALNVLGVLGKIDAYWTGTGSGLLVVGVINLLRLYRLNKNEAYKEKVELDLNDERNRFLRSKAWAWAGYMFVIIAAVMSIIFKLFHFDSLSIASGGAVCLVIALFWISYYMLRKKY